MNSCEKIITKRTVSSAWKTFLRQLENFKLKLPICPRSNPFILICLIRKMLDVGAELGNLCDLSLSPSNIPPKGRHKKMQR